MQPRKYQGRVVLEFACSGALIDRQYVITSAHCVIYSADNDYVVSIFTRVVHIGPVEMY